jgi:hypothetical protein
VPALDRCIAPVPGQMAKPTATPQRREDAISEFLFLNLPACLAAAFRPAATRRAAATRGPPHGDRGRSQPSSREVNRFTAKSGSIVGSRRSTYPSPPRGN